MNCLAAIVNVLANYPPETSHLCKQRHLVQCMHHQPVSAFLAPVCPDVLCSSSSNFLGLCQGLLCTVTWTFNVLFVPFGSCPPMQHWELRLEIRFHQQCLLACLFVFLQQTTNVPCRLIYPGFIPGENSAWENQVKSSALLSMFQICLILPKANWLLSVIWSSWCQKQDITNKKASSSVDDKTFKGGADY